MPLTMTGEEEVIDTAPHQAARIFLCFFFSYSDSLYTYSRLRHKHTIGTTATTKKNQNNEILLHQSKSPGAGLWGTIRVEQSRI